MLSVLMCLKPDERGGFLAQAFESLKLQTRPADEVVLIQDGPAAAALLPIIEQYREVLKLREFVLTENGGLGAALAFGLEKCRGELVARFDSDDVSLPRRFELQIAAFEDDPDLAILSGYAREIDAEGTPGALRMVPQSHEQIFRLLPTNPMVHPAVMFRRAAVLAAGSYRADLRRAQDYDLWFRCAGIGLKFANLPRVLIHYRFTPADIGKRSRAAYWQQGMIGFSGASALGPPLAARLSCFLPFLRSLLPRALQGQVLRLLRPFDPRHREW